MNGADVYTRSLFPSFDRYTEDKEEQKQIFIDRFEMQRKAIKPFFDAIEQHAPFINAEIYKKLCDIRQLIHHVTIITEGMMRKFLDRGNLGDLDSISSVCTKLNQAVIDISTDVRNYLSTLKIQD